MTGFPDWATHGICLWGSAGKTFDHTRAVPYREQLLFGFTKEQAATFLAIDWEKVYSRTRTSMPRLTEAEVITEVNRTLRKKHQNQMTRGRTIGCHRQNYSYTQGS